MNLAVMYLHTVASFNQHLKIEEGRNRITKKHNHQTKENKFLLLTNTQF